MRVIGQRDDNHVQSVKSLYFMAVFGGLQRLSDNLRRMRQTGIAVTTGRNYLNVFDLHQILQMCFPVESAGAKQGDSKIAIRHK